MKWKYLTTELLTFSLDLLISLFYDLSEYTKMHYNVIYLFVRCVDWTKFLFCPNSGIFDWNDFLLVFDEFPSDS